MKNTWVALVLFGLLSCTTKKADLIIHHAQIYTVDSAFSIAEAIAVKDGIIVAVGTNDEILKKFQSNNSIDAEGKAIYPGLIDGHAHFVGYGQSLFAVQLYGVSSVEEIQQRIEAFVKEHPEEEWIIGRGWDQNKFPGKQYPSNDFLNKLFPNKPVLLTRVDGHAAIANDAALKLAGVKPGQTIIGGAIETKNGKLTGILIDNAVDLVSEKIPAPTSSTYEKWLTAAQKKCFAQGLTTITDCGLMYNDVEMIEQMHQSGKLDMRLYVMLSDHPENYKRYLASGPKKTDKLFVKGIKVYADGALGSRGACLLQHYADKKDWFGFLLKPEYYYDSLASVLVKSDFQMCTHAIGDSANRTILKIYNKYLNGKNDKRWRIEHAQVVNEKDFDLFGNANIIPSVQPTHATSDMYWAGERLGKEREKGAYAYQQLLQQNGWLNLGTDFPVEDISPFKTFLAAVVRKDANGFPADGYQKENALSREQAIRGMTIWAAKANFMENEIGSIEVGKKADFIILDQDFMKVDEKIILNIKVLSTYLNGKKVH